MKYMFEMWFKEIYTSENGLAGYESFLDNQIDLIITDINLPFLNGIDMVTKIREIDNSIPIIIISSHLLEDYSNEIVA